MFGDGSDECDCSRFAEASRSRSRRCTQWPPARCARIRASVCSEERLRTPLNASIWGSAVAFRCGVDVETGIACCADKLTLLPPVFQEIKQKAEPPVQLHWLLRKMLHCNSSVISTETLLLELERLRRPKDAQKKYFFFVNVCKWNDSSSSALFVLHHIHLAVLLPVLHITLWLLIAFQLARVVSSCEIFSRGPSESTSRAAVCCRWTNAVGCGSQSDLEPHAYPSVRLAVGFSLKTNAVYFKFQRVVCLIVV